MAAPQPTTHPAWCQPATCTTAGTDTTHRHLVGCAGDVEVWVQRTDTVRADGTHLHGHTGVHVRSGGVQNLTAVLDALRALLAVAEVFADEVEGVR